MLKANGSENMRRDGETQAFIEGMNASLQCRLVLNDPRRGYERLCREATGRYPYHARLTRNALNAQYRSVFPTAEYPAGLGAGTWIRCVRDAANEQAERWSGVGVWARVFRSFHLELRLSDLEWKVPKKTNVTCHDELAAEEIYITGLGAERPVRIVSTWIPNWEFVQRCFTQALGRSAAIQVLLLDPNSPQAAYCADALCMSPDAMQQEIHGSLRALDDFYRDQEISKLAPSRFEVRLYDHIPIASIFWYDDTAYVGPHWMRQHSTLIPQFRLERDKNSMAFCSMEQHFDALWAGASKRRFLPE